MTSTAAHLAHACYESACGFLRDKITASLVFAGVTLPLWHALLKTASENAALLTPLVFLAVAIMKLFNEWPRREGDERSSLLARLVPDVAKLKRWGFILAAVLSIGAVFLFISKSHAPAAPMQIPAADGISKPKRKTDDDAGADGDAEDDGPSGHVLFDFARTFVGNTPEALPNGRANPKVRAMFEAVNGFKDGEGRITADPRKTAWCSVFVNYVCMCKNIARTNNAMARSWLRWGQAVELEAAQLGDVVVLWRGKYDDGETGHVGFFAGWEGARLKILGGNQDDEVKVVLFARGRVLGVRRYRSLAKSRTMIGSAVKGGSALGAGGLAAAEAMSDQAPAAPVAPSIIEHIEHIREPVSSFADYLPGRWRSYAIIFCAVLGLAGAAVVWYERRRLRNETGQ